MKDFLVRYNANDGSSVEVVFGYVSITISQDMMSQALKITKFDYNDDEVNRQIEMINNSYISDVAKEAAIAAIHNERKRFEESLNETPSFASYIRAFNSGQLK